MSFFDGLPQGGKVNAPSRTRPHGNLRLLKFALVALFGILTIQLVNMQIIHGDDYARRARENHITSSNILPARGLIYDADGSVLVQNIALYTATVTPDFLPSDPDKRYQMFLQLEELLGVPALEIQTAVAEYEDDAPWTNIPIKQGLTHEQALMLEEAQVDMPGVALTVTPTRTYVGGNNMSHILGFVGPQDAIDAAALADKGYQLTEFIGKAGIESQYEAELRGEAGSAQAEVDAFGQLVESISSVDPEPGNSLRLSIDLDLQNQVAEILSRYQAEAPTAAAVVMDANTGAIYALVSLPTYDNNIFTDLTDPANLAAYEELADNDWSRPLVNHAIADENIPGSVFKLVTATAGLEEGVITPATGVYVDSLYLEQRDVNDEIFSLKDWRVHGYVDLRSAISWSSNIYFYETACGLLDGSREGLGPERLGAWARNFGFGQRTGIDVGGEAIGRVPSPEWKRQYFFDNFGAEEDWFYGNTCFMGIGQEYVTSSPLQVARMTAAVANGGNLVTPRVVQAVIEPDGTERLLEPEYREIPVDDANLQVIREGMRMSVTGGAAARAGSDIVAVAGKTGTAEFRDIGSGQFQNHAWFTSFAPYEAPEIVVTVYFELGWGGDKAAPAAREIIDYYFSSIAP